MWYELAIRPDSNDTWLVTSPEFPELTTFGETQQEALENGRKAIEEAIAGRIADSEDIPAPSPDAPEPGTKGCFVQISAMIHLKSALYMLMRAKEWTRADLMRALGCKREHVDRLFRLDHNSRLSSLEEAFEALGVVLRFDVPFMEKKAA